MKIEKAGIEQADIVGQVHSEAWQQDMQMFSQLECLLFCDMIASKDGIARRLV